MKVWRTALHGYMAQDKGMGTALRKQRVYGKSQREKRAIHGNIPLSSFVRRAAQGQKGLAASYVAQPSLRQTVQTPSLLFHPPPPPPVGCMWFPRLGCVWPRPLPTAQLFSSNAHRSDSFTKEKARRMRCAPCINAHRCVVPPKKMDSFLSPSGLSVSPGQK